MTKQEKIEEIRNLLTAGEHSKARNFAYENKITNSEFNKIWCEYFGIKVID